MNATPTAANRRSAKKYSPGLAGALAAFFKMRDDSTESFVKEFVSQRCWNLGFFSVNFHAPPLGVFLSLGGTPINTPTC